MNRSRSHAIAAALHLDAARISLKAALDALGDIAEETNAKPMCFGEVAGALGCVLVAQAQLDITQRALTRTTRNRIKVRKRT